jgi:ABC-type sugar transport system ATPase subunit
MTASAGADLAIGCHAVSRGYGGTQALSEVDLEIRPGTIHALVGENGAGKSTLLGVLAGRVVPDSGEVRVFGQPLAFGSPRHVRASGIAAIYQELTIVPALSAAANAFLGMEMRHGPALNSRGMHERFRSLSRRLGISIEPGVRADRLKVADQQLIEIMRGLVSDARVLLLDEPTTALPEEERDALFTVLRGLRDEGVTILLVSHNLDEVLALSDTITVLRNGRHVSTAPARQWTKSQLVADMLGRTVENELFVRRQVAGDVVLEVAGLTVPGALEAVDLTARRGEIIGLAGLMGSGRTTLMRALAGLEPTAQGTLTIDGRSRSWPHSAVAGLRHGLVLLPEDRRQGLVLGMAAADNVTLGNWRGTSRFGLIHSRRQQRLTREVVSRLGFDASRSKERVRLLSGGNQQKVLVAKSVHRGPLVLLADEPTRGIDVGARAEILAVLGQLAAAGLTIIVASSELEEVLEISDRVVVLHFGRVAAELGRDDPDWSVKGVLSRAFSVDVDA